MQKPPLVSSVSGTLARGAQTVKGWVGSLTKRDSPALRVFTERCTEASAVGRRPSAAASQFERELVEGFERLEEP